MESRLKTIMADVLDVDESELDDDASMDTIDSWRSLNHLSLMLALEEEFGVRFPESQIADLTSVRAIREALSGMTTR